MERSARWVSTEFPLPYRARRVPTGVSKPVVLRLHAFSVFISPQPSQRIRQNGVPVDAVIRTFPKNKPIIVIAGEFQCGGHLLVGQRPISVLVVQVFRSVLKKHANGLTLGLAKLDRHAHRACSRSCQHDSLLSGRRRAVPMRLGRAGSLWSLREDFRCAIQSFFLPRCRVLPGCCAMVERRRGFAGV